MSVRQTSTSAAYSWFDVVSAEKLYQYTSDLYPQLDGEKFLEADEDNNLLVILSNRDWREWQIFLTEDVPNIIITSPE